MGGVAGSRRRLSGRAGRFGDAVLKGYKDATQRKKAAKAALEAEAEAAELARLDGIYAAAEALEGEGKYLEARDQFQLCPGHRDADARAQACVEAAWEEALARLEAQDYEGAEQLYLGLGVEGYEEEYTYRKGLALYAAGDYAAALSQLEAVAEYADVPQILAGDMHIAPLYYQDQHKPGEVVTFGEYPAGTPMEWYVLDVQEGRCLLLSRYLLSEGRKHYGVSPVNGWPDSPLRKWLNESFYNEAFSDSDKAQIVKTQLTNMARQTSAKDVAFKDTSDMVFLLSLDEFEHYLTNDAAGRKGDAVQALQQKLIELGYLTGKADGDYGNMTLNAVSAFQKDAGLPQTGVADGDTQALLFAR